MPEAMHFRFESVERTIITPTNADRELAAALANFKAKLSEAKNLPAFSAEAVLSEAITRVRAAKLASISFELRGASYLPFLPAK